MTDSFAIFPAFRHARRGMKAVLEKRPRQRQGRPMPESKQSMQTFISHIAWESEVWIAEDPDHMVLFNGERFLGPYPDVMPTS